MRPSCSLGETHLGYLGEVDRRRLEAFELREPCSAAELEFDVLSRRAELVPQYQPLPPFPASSATCRWSCRGRLPGPSWPRSWTAAAGPTLESIDYLDTFQGGNVPDGQAEPPLRPALPPPGADADRRGSRAAVKAIVDACAARFEAVTARLSERGDSRDETGFTFAPRSGRR